MKFEGIKNIVFDLGDVIINIDPPRTYQAFADLLECSLKEAYVKVDGAGFFDRYDRGEFNDSEFLSFVRAELGIEVSDALLMDCWNALLLDIPKQRIERIQALSKKYNLYLLSNTTAIHIDAVNDILEQATGVADLKELFIKTYYSFDMKMRKPDEEIYVTMLSDGNMIAEETVFLDDTLKNVEAANKVGIHGLYVTKENDMLTHLQNA